MRIKKSRRGEFYMVESSAVENIRERIRRKFAVSSHSIIHMSMMGTQSTYFDSALVL